MKNCFSLLKSWCDTLVANRIHSPDPHFHGSVPCPACHVLHGRVVDAVYPLSLLYHRTGEAKYLECAKDLVAFAEHNLLRARGEYRNDVGSDWIGTSVFASIAFGEALFYHGEALDEDTRAQFTAIHRRLTDFVRLRFVEPDFSANVNYFASYTAAMAIAYRLTGETVYAEAGRGMANRLRSEFTSSLILTGEGPRRPTKKGLLPVDMGYNVEESLPAFTLFSYFMEDEEWMDFTRRAWHAHLPFMLPDGGWDNSFGSRHYKWTYYGSRTSDGCQTGLAYLWDKDPVLAEAALRNYRLMAACSGNGYLYGGPMYAEAGELPCLHHSFVHAKALAAMLDRGFAHEGGVSLPADEAQGLTVYEALQVARAAEGDYRATVSCNDFAAKSGAETGGGTLTMLYHMAYGPIFAATMADYERFEVLNMQHCRHRDQVFTATPRIEQGAFSSPYALDATLSAHREGETTTVTATGCLTSKKGERGAPYSLTYRLTDEGLTVTALAEENATLYLPVVCGAKGTITLDGVHAAVTHKNATVHLHSDGILSYNAEKDRLFHPVGGFLYAAFSLPLPKRQAVTVRLWVEQKTL